MEIDMNRLETAIMYLDRIANGHNPVNNLRAEEDEVLNDPNVIRCMFFVKEVLEEVKRNGGNIGRRMKKSELAEYPIDVLNSFKYEEDKSITRLVEQMNKDIDVEKYKKMKYTTIVQWLKDNGYLVEKHVDELKKNCTCVTEKGEKIGIKSEIKTNMNAINYMSIIYTKDAQCFIVNNIKTIVTGEMPKNIEDE